MKTTEIGKCMCVGSAGKCKCVCVGSAGKCKCVCVESEGKCKCVCVESEGKCKCMCVESATRATHKAKHNHAGCLSLGCSSAFAPSRGRSVATLLSRPVGFPPSAGSHQRGQSLRGHRCAPCDIGNVHCEPCGVFVVRGSFRMLLQQQQFHPESKPSQPESVTLISSQKDTAPPSLPRLAVLAFAPLPALRLRLRCGQWASLRSAFSRFGQAGRFPFGCFLSGWLGLLSGCSCCCFTNVKLSSLHL